MQDKGQWHASSSDILAAVTARHGDLFSILGLHEHGSNWVMRALEPGADRVSVHQLDGTHVGGLERVHPDGFFEGIVDVSARAPLRLRFANSEAQWEHVDPYSFGPVLGPMDDYYISEGNHLRLYDKLGAHLLSVDGVEGTHFAVWAPNAARVSVVGDFNGWDGRRHVMRKRGDTGVWEIFIPAARTAQRYKFELLDQHGRLLPLKADPFGSQSELRPQNASVVAPPPDFTWTDEAYLARRREKDHTASPMSIYEVHLGSWRKSETGGFLSYQELADQLVSYASDMGFTHIELLPVSEYPYDPSWGYQPTGLFAPTSRFGSPEGFAYFVDRAHAAGLGIILDWVPAHFPTDEHGLARFDGTALYEHLDQRQGFHPDWNTAIYNFGRKEVSAFLVNNALYWLERFHIDGLRVDAVASMLYLDYSRKQGEWIPNRHGGRENLEAIEFLQRMNHEAYGQHPGIVTIAEESTAFPGVSKPTSGGGLGFGFKWNMGFMHDTLNYMQRDPIHRRHHHNDLTFGLLYAFSENFVLPLSHDEVVHGKGSLLNKMSGDDWQKFATLRAYLAFMWGYPGKKLLFMGQEFAQRTEWNHAQALDWHLLDHESHKGMQALVRDLNGHYCRNAALHEKDCQPNGFQWLIVDDSANSVFAWLRTADNAPPMAVICNFTPLPRYEYRVPLPASGRWKEILNTDAKAYWGSGQGNAGETIADKGPFGGLSASAALTLPPLATIYLLAQ